MGILEVLLFLLIAFVVPWIVLASYLHENRGHLVDDLKFWWQYERPGRRHVQIPLG